MPKPGERKEDNREETKEQTDPGEQQPAGSTASMSENDEPETESDRLMNTMKHMKVLTQAFEVISKHAKKKMNSDPYMKTVIKGVAGCYTGLYLKKAELMGNELDDASMRILDKNLHIPPEKMNDFLRQEHEGKTNYQICREQLKEGDRKTFDKYLLAVSNDLNLGINLEELQGVQKKAEKKDELKPEEKKEERKPEEKKEERKPEEKKEERGPEEKKNEQRPEEEKKEEQGPVEKNKKEPKAPQQPEAPKEQPDKGENIQGVDPNVMEMVKNLSVLHGYLSMARKKATSIPSIYNPDDDEIYDYKRDSLAGQMQEYVDTIALTAADFTGAAIDKADEDLRNELPALDTLGQFLAQREKIDGKEGKTNFQHIVECLPEGMDKPFAEAVQGLSNSLQLGIDADALLKEAQRNVTRERAETWKKTMGFDREEEKTAQEWIEREKDIFKKNKWDKVEAIDGKIPEEYAKSCARIMAARMLTDAKRGKKSSLDKPMLWDKLDRKAEELMQDSTFLNFMKRAVDNPELAEKIHKAVGKGHAGGLEDAFKEYVRDLPPGELENKPILKRYMPTAKERIESLQAQAKNAAQNHKTALLPNDKQMYAASMKRAAAEILELRNMVKAEWGRKKSVDRPIPVQSHRKGEPAVPDLKAQVRALAGNHAMEGTLLREDVQDLLGKGHGGLMAEKIRKAPGVNNPDVKKNSIQGQIENLKKRAAELNNARQEGRNVDEEARTVISQYCILTEAAGKNGENLNRDAPWDALDKMKEREMSDKVIGMVAGKSFVKNGLTENLGEVLSHVANAAPTKFKEAVKMTVEADKGKKAPTEMRRKKQAPEMSLET